MDQVTEKYAELVAMLDHLSADGRALAERAYHFAREAHGTQQRKSGEPYIMHPIEVARLLAEMQMDAPSLAAALLHDVIEDTPVTYTEMEAEFGTEVANLVLGVTKLGARVKDLKYLRMAAGSDLTYEERQAASWVNLLLAMAEDLRVIVIKLGDRLHNMRTVQYLKPSKQRQKAQETVDLFVPLAARLGIRAFWRELDNLSLYILEPDTYAEIEGMLQARARLLMQDFEDLLVQLHYRLEEDGIAAQVSALPESVSNVYRYIEKHGWESARTYDGLRLQIIVETRAACYAVLGSVHRICAPIPGRITDFIATPKEGLYRSLQTVVIGPRGYPVEVRIRTPQMKHLIVYGAVVYLQTRHHASQEGVEAPPNWPWLDHMGELPPGDPETFLNLFKSDIAPERIRVFTPKGDVKELPVGATPVDFAYAVHTVVGDSCRGVLINSRHAPLNRELQNGDQIEIIRWLTPAPNRAWLDEDLGYARNPYTLRHIRRWFAHQPEEVLLEQGRMLIEKEILCWGNCVGWTASSSAVLARQRGLTEKEFCLRVGKGEITARELSSLVLDEVLGHPQGRIGTLTLEIQAMDRPNLLRDACQIVAEDNVNIHSAWARGIETTSLAVVQLTVGVPSIRKIVRIVHRLEHMLSVLAVERIKPEDQFTLPDACKE